MESQTQNRYQAKGNELYAIGDYAGAKEQYKMWTDTSPVTADAWRLLGFAQYAVQEFDAAVESMIKASKLGPENADNHFGLGMAQLALNNVDSGIDALDEAVVIRPDHPHAKKNLTDALCRRAQSHLQTGDDLLAERDFDRAVKVGRQDPDAIIAFGKYLIDSGQKPRAVKLIQQALINVPGDKRILSAAAHLGVSADAATASDAAKKAQVQQSQQKQCPACKQLVMNWAAVCPHCNSVIGAIPSQFAGRDTGPRYTWKEIAYKIMCVYWIGMGVYSVISGFLMTKRGGPTLGFESIFYAIGGLQIAMGLGLLFEVEWVQFIAKLLCILNAIFAAWGILMQFGLGHIVGGLVQVAALGLTLFQIYLLSEMSD